MSTLRPTDTLTANVAAGRAWRRVRVPAALALGVLLVHAAVLLGSSVIPSAGRPLSAAVELPAAVMQLVPMRPMTRANPASEDQLVAPAESQAAPLSQPPQPPQALLQPLLQPLLPTQPQSATTMNSSPREPLAERSNGSVIADVPAPSASPNVPWPEATAEGQPVPVYATAPPTAATLEYTLHRFVQGGVRSGLARIVWAPTAEGYTLSLAAVGGPLAGLGAASRGVFDAAGLAPERFVDRRHGRDVRATNFQREAGRLGHSGSPVTTELQPGTQDRLSWLLQLPAVLQSNPALAQPGAQVLMWVAVGRGAPQVWAFTVTGSTRVELADGTAVPALHLQRKSDLPYDQQVDVWLDPARQHLPLRVRLAAPPGPWSSELLLTGLIGVPP